MKLSTDIPSFIKATETGLELSDDLTFEEWQGIAGSFGKALQTAAWCIGDWMVYGERKWGNQLLLPGQSFDTKQSRVSSEVYNQAISSTGLDLSTLKSYASICRSIPKEQRRSELSFGHHACLASTPSAEREEWLKVVTSQPSRPSIKRLRLSVRVSPDSPRIITDSEIMDRGSKSGHDNYVPHLMKLEKLLRQTLPEMSDYQRQALKDDTRQLLELLQSI